MYNVSKAVLQFASYNLKCPILFSIISIFSFFEDLEIQPGMFLSVGFAQTVDSTMLYLF